MDRIAITILENGNVRIDTDRISAPNHANAEAAIRWLSEQLGGPVTVQRKVHTHTHTHEHDHTHDHEHA